MPNASILVPVDGSEASAEVLEYIPALKAIGDLRVRLIGIATDEWSSPEASNYLQDLAATTEAKYGVGVEWICREGNPPAQILAEAANPWVSMLLMATHGHSSGEPWRLGSVADKVIRGATCPSFVLSPEAALRKAPEAFRRILLPLDGSALAEEALPVAAGLTRKMQGELLLVTAYLPLAVPIVPWPGSSYADLSESSATAAEGYLERVEEGLALDGQVHRAAVLGVPSEVILRKSAEHSADLLVMTSHGRHGFVRWALGSVADRLIRGPVPVLVIQPGQGERLIRLLSS
jgi:nucleotide-binding universal stress UspA family protein